MTMLIRGLISNFVTVLIAIWHSLLRKRHARYTAFVDVRAPRSAIWEILVAPEVTYQPAGLTVRLTPIDGRPDCYTSAFTLRGREMPGPALHYALKDPQSRLVACYLRELSPSPDQIGENDTFTAELTDRPGGRTRLTYSRELNHLRAATRISVPVGLRHGLHLVRLQAEHAAGFPAPAPSVLSHFAWTLAAFVSFALLLGLTDALVLMAVIAIHEAGHALAMLRYGLGINIVGFVPFLGGIAAPRRYYENAWQKSVVLLMGVGASLPVTLALAGLTWQTGNERLADATMLFAIVNGSNLLPLPGLDGGQVATLLSTHIHRHFRQALTWLMTAAFVALGLALQSPIVWVAVAFGIVQAAVTSSLGFDDRLQRMRPLKAWLVLVSYFVLLAIYVAVIYAVLRLQDLV